MTFGPGRSGVVLFNWNTWKSLHCECGSVALLSCVMGQFICVWQGQYLGVWMGMKGLMSLHVAVWGKLGKMGPEKDIHPASMYMVDNVSEPGSLGLVFDQ